MRRDIGGDGGFSTTSLGIGYENSLGIHSYLRYPGIVVA